eukprot:g1203.t1
MSYSQGFSAGEKIVIDIGSGTTRGGYAGDDHPSTSFPSICGFREGDGTMLDSSSVSSHHSHGKKRQRTTINNRRNENHTLVGNEIFLKNLSSLQSCEVEHAFSNGCVSNWEVLEYLWEKVYSNLTAGRDPTETFQTYPLVMSMHCGRHGSPSFSSSQGIFHQSSGQDFHDHFQTHSRMCELAFEKFSIPYLSIQNPASLSCFATGHRSGCVLDIGAQTSRVIPVFEGYALPSPFQVETPLAGNTISHELHYLIEERHSLMIKSRNLFRKIPITVSATTKKKAAATPKTTKTTASSTMTTKYRMENISPVKYRKSFNDFMQLYTSEEMKATLCRLVVDSDFDEEALANVQRQPFTLPDGTFIDVGSERFRAPEILFRPKVLGKTTPLQISLHEQNPLSCPNLLIRLFTNLTRGLSLEKQNVHPKNKQLVQRRNDQGFGFYSESDYDRNHTHSTGRIDNSFHHTTDQRQRSTDPAISSTSSSSEGGESSNEQTQRSLLLAAYSDEMLREMKSNIIVCGGGGRIPGFKERFEREIYSGIHSLGLSYPKVMHKVKLKTIYFPAMKEMNNCTWLGGSIVGSLGDYSLDTYLNKADYEEHGERLLRLKIH